MAGLNLVPNKSIGFRIRPDYYNWTVVHVKEKGANSKDAGQQYDTTIGYYKSLEAAVHAIVELSARMQGEELQKDAAAESGDIASISALANAIEAAKAAAFEAVAQFQKDMDDAGVSVWHIAKQTKPQGSSPDGANPDVVDETN
ncbi:hypothetical protein F6X40_10850 [Paraburkholderia sp. UCT31]|uniref:hypothetical protein n=1 Tax=Paraburkholderia sp. UCT31 TaxID=2615209 RepID=UPI001654E0B3|nr:hypothetical protein [Paraburkholderia sp. UCT31]MBC8737305.1 hypothetical protein [Paraburkholderia sp. UCT31]